MGGSIRKEVGALLRPIVERGFELWNVEYVKEGGDWQLRVYIDKAGSANLDDCEEVSRFLSERLDERDLIAEAYSLIVSSPGMDRQLFTDEHFARYVGAAVEVSLYKGFEGRKKFAALLGQKTDETLYLTPIDALTLAPVAAEIAAPVSLVNKVCLLVVF